MTQIPIFLLSLCYLAQSAEPVSPAPGATASLPGQPAVEAETDAEKAIRAAADKIDGIEYVSVRLRQTIRAAGKAMQSAGSYKRGPNNRGRLDLLVDIGAGTATRVNASDGTTCSLYEKILDREECQSFDVKQVMSLLDNREMPPEVRQQLFLSLPFVSPGDMLRGYLKTMHFDAMREDNLGSPPRPATLFEGRWKDNYIPVVAQDPSVKRIEDLTEGIPQYIRLYLDKETGFPVRIELFRKDKRAEYKPMFQLEFLEVQTAKIDDKEFVFDVPKSAKFRDVTAEFVQRLSELPPKTKTPSATSAAEAVAEPIQKPRQP